MSIPMSKRIAWAVFFAVIAAAAITSVIILN